MHSNQHEAVRDRQRADHDWPALWAIVLAGGDDVRLRALTRRLCGDDRPHQYAALIGSRSMLRHTLDRAALLIPRARTVVVTSRSHAQYIVEEFGRAGDEQVLVQPEDRGTAASLLLPAHWVAWQDPEATVAVFPSGHFILEEAAFMGQVLEVAAFVNRNPRWIVLLGAQPTGPESEYGWIEPAATVAWTTTGPISRVRCFRERPSIQTARACLHAGWLWNTSIIVAKAATLIEAGRLVVPAVHDRLARIGVFAGTPEEAWAIHQAFALLPAADFSMAVLEPGVRFLLVSAMPAVGWSDWGSPGRVVESLRKAGIATRALEPTSARSR
jgi:mannose-1-phosphate guanylyltransferase